MGMTKVTNKAQAEHSKNGNCHRLWNKHEFWKSSVLLWGEVKTKEKCEKKVGNEVDEDPENLSHDAKRYGEVSFLKLDCFNLSCLELKSIFLASNWQRRFRYWTLFVLVNTHFSVAFWTCVLYSEKQF